MQRYHKDIYYPANAQEYIQALTDKLNGLKWQYSKHCIENLKYRLVNIKAVLLFVKQLRLKPEQVFEYYIKEDKILKACYRVLYNTGIDIIIVVNSEKNIVTIYVNEYGDKHYTLNKSVYNKE